MLGRAAPEDEATRSRSGVWSVFIADEPGPAPPTMTAATSTDESTTGLRPATRAVVAGRGA